MPGLSFLEDDARLGSWIDAGIPLSRSFATGVSSIGERVSGWEGGGGGGGGGRGGGGGGEEINVLTPGIASPQCVTLRTTAYAAAAYDDGGGSMAGDIPV